MYLPVASQSSIGASGTVVPRMARTMENGPAGLRCRDVNENSNARFVRAPSGSGFIAVIAPGTEEIFFPDFALRAP
jgi:hypothetical protein